MAGEVSVVNDMDCPYILSTHCFEVVPSANILGSISLIHECMSSCSVVPIRTASIEREQVLISGVKSVRHDLTNDLYILNLYCMNYHHIIESL